MEKVPDWILVGEVKRPHGTGGEVLVRSHTEHTGRFKAGARLFMTDRSGEDRREMLVVSSRITAKGPLIKLEGCSSREQAMDLGGSLLFIPGSDILPVEPGSYYAFQLEGCTIIAGNKQVGIVSSLLETPANAVLEVKPDGGGPTVYIPLVRNVILSVDLERRQIMIPEDFLG